MDRRNWLTLELTNNCNMQCPRCSQFSISQKPKGFMKPALFKQLIDSLVEHKITLNNIDPFFRGESLLHPQFAELMNYLYEASKKHPVCDFIKLHTNAEFLNEKNGDAILKLCDQSVLRYPGDLFLSIDAATAKTHKIVRPNGNFERVIDNIKWFLAERERRKQYGPSMVFQFIIQPENRHEAQLFLDYWGSHFQKMGIEYEVDRSLGPEIGQVCRTTIYFRRLSSWHEDRQKNEELQKTVMRELGLVE